MYTGSAQDPDFLDSIRKILGSMELDSLNVNHSSSGDQNPLKNNVVKYPPILQTLITHVLWWKSHGLGGTTSVRQGAGLNVRCRS